MGDCLKMTVQDFIQVKCLLFLIDFYFPLSHIIVKNLEQKKRKFKYTQI